MQELPTPKRLYEIISNSLLKNTDIGLVLTMDAAERRAFTLEQAEHTLSMNNAAEWLNDLFWTADKELTLMSEDHPWMADETTLKSREQLSDLSDEEYQVAGWIMELALLIHNLIIHVNFDLDSLADNLTKKGSSLDEAFAYENEALVGWIRETPYRRVAALVCHQLLDAETNKAIKTNVAIQDFYATECWRERTHWWDAAACEAFMNTSLNAMQEVKEHYQKGHDMGLSDEHIRVLDAIWGFAPHFIDIDDIPFVHEVCEAADKRLPEKPYVKSEMGRRLYMDAVFSDIKPIFEKYDYEFNPSDSTDLTPSYISSWLYDKYYK